MANGAHGQWGTWAMGHMGNVAHGPWGTWAMGPMGDLHIFAYNFINTGWILTKIALCGLRWFKLNVSKCQKDVKCQKFKHVDYGGGSQKK